MSSTTNDRLQDTRGESSRTSEGPEEKGRKRMGERKGKNAGALGSKVDEDVDERDGREKSSREIGIAARIHIFRRNYKCNASFSAA